MELKPGDDLAHFQYVTKEYFVSGTANGQPYKTRIVIRKPSDNSRFSGLVLAESMHPSGNPWMFHFTHTYSMTEGHIGLEILTSDTAGLHRSANPERYKDLVVGNGQANEIIAQVGALMKSKRPDNPLAGLPIRKMILAGSSASAAVVVNYLPAHMVQRLADMKPIYDGFMPTSNGANLRKIDVPMIQVPTMREVFQGTARRVWTATRPAISSGSTNSPAWRTSIRAMPRRTIRIRASCRSAGFRWRRTCRSRSIISGSGWTKAPCRRTRIASTWTTTRTGDGSLLALDESGNVKGGIRNPYVDVPAAKFGVPNSGAEPPIKNPHPFIAARGEAAQNQLCGLANYQINFTPAQLKKLYKDKKTIRPGCSSVTTSW